MDEKKQEGRAGGQVMKLRCINRSINRLYAACFLALGLVACTPAPSDALRLGTNVWPGYEPLYLARDLGWLDETEVRLVEYASSTQVMRGLRDGVLDAAALTLDEALTLCQDGLPLKVILVMDVSNGADAVVARNDIAGIGDLRGRRIGAETSALGALMTTRLLEQAGLEVTDVDLVPLPINTQFEAFRKGQVDAVVTFEPVLSQLLADGGKVIFDSSQISGEIVDVLVVNAQALKRHHGHVRSLVRQWFRALDYLHRNRADAVQRMAPRLKLSAGQVEASFKGLMLPPAEKVGSMMIGDKEHKPSLLEALERLQDVMLRHGLLQRHVDPSGMMDAAWVREFVH